MSKLIWLYGPNEQIILRYMLAFLDPQHHAYDVFRFHTKTSSQTLVIPIWAGMANRAELITKYRKAKGDHTVLIAGDMKDQGVPKIHGLYRPNDTVIFALPREVQFHVDMLASPTMRHKEARREKEVWVSFLEKYFDEIIEYGTV